jgi:hypothetical protein
MSDRAVARHSSARCAPLQQGGLLRPPSEPDQAFSLLPGDMLTSSPRDVVRELYEGGTRQGSARNAKNRTIYDISPFGSPTRQPERAWTSGHRHACSRVSRPDAPGRRTGRPSPAMQPQVSAVGDRLDLGAPPPMRRSPYAGKHVREAMNSRRSRRAVEMSGAARSEGFTW